MVEGANKLQTLLYIANTTLVLYSQTLRLSCGLYTVVSINNETHDFIQIKDKGEHTVLDHLHSTNVYRKKTRSFPTVQKKLVL